VYKTISVFAVLLVGCAQATYNTMRETKIQEPKVVALDAPREPYTIEVEKRLKAAGFKVLRLPTRKVVKEQTSDTRTEIYKEAEARYVVYLEADVRERCFAGGYNFRSLTAELVDVKTNETVFSMNDSGYSENCPPLSGKIYSKAVQGVQAAWY
jgi:hypothetical protein